MKCYHLLLALLVGLVPLACNDGDGSSLHTNPQSTGASGSDGALAMVEPADAGQQGPDSPAEKRPQAQTVVARTESESGAVVARLSNGLTVIVKTKDTAPVVVVQSFVHAGGMYEREWLGCGLSHLLEHLVADGADHASQSGGVMEASRDDKSRITRIGGQSNAYTSMNRTAYYIAASSDKTDECIDLIADWMARPQFSEEDFHREHGVVQRELEKGKDEPNRQMWYANARNVFGEHPASVPVIGYARPLSEVTWQDIRAYHKRMYVPQNMIFVVVGDVDPDRVLKRTCNAFAGFEKGRVPPLSLPDVPAFTGIRRVQREFAGLSDVMEDLNFQTIPLQHKDLYALDVLDYILGSGRSSRLYRKLVEDAQLVTSVSTSSWTPAWGKGIFNVSFRCEPGKEDQAEKALLAELKKIADEGVDADELKRAKRQKVADWVYSQQTVQSVAGTLGGDYLSTGDVDFSQNYTDRIQAVTAEEVHRAAKKYFDFDRMAITRLVPEIQVDRQDSQETRTSGKLQAMTLPSGLRVILQPSKGAGLVSMAFVSKGGVLAETEETNGLGQLMASMSTRGTAGFSKDEIAEFFDQAGGSISGQCGNNSFYWQATVLADSANKAVEIFADVIARPAFNEEDLQVVRKQQLAAIERVDEHWFSQLSRTFRKEFFGDSPYSRLAVGDTDVVSEATPKQLRRFHDKWVIETGGVLAVYGDFDADDMAAKLKKLFGKVKFGDFRRDPLPKVDARTVDSDGELRVLKTDKKVCGVMVARPSMEVTDLKDRIPLTVLDTIISGYRLPSGWLHEELRGKKLVYVVHAHNQSGLRPGAFITYAACQPEKAREVVDIIKRNLREASTYTPTQTEIDRAVNTILTADVLGNQSLSSLAIGTALDELYGLGYDHHRKQAKLYQAVTPEDVARVAKKILSGGYVVVATTPQPEVLENDSTAGDDSE